MSILKKKKRKGPQAGRKTAFAPYFDNDGNDDDDDDDDDDL